MAFSGKTSLRRLVFSTLVLVGVDGRFFVFFSRCIFGEEPLVGKTYLLGKPMVG